ncbi:MAG: ABC transporter substrate-binding protein, partial [Betaproteobacteria bacterium]|nr:ABC transporter substrate-binding protein [Betaproteobacteria bacterium]
MLRSSVFKGVAALSLATAMNVAFAQETYKIGIVSFLSGQAAESFGIPAVNGAKWLVEQFNNG